MASATSEGVTMAPKRHSDSPSLDVAPIENDNTGNTAPLAAAVGSAESAADASQANSQASEDAHIPASDSDHHDGGSDTTDMPADAAAWMPFIHKCQAMLADGDVCKTLDPESCAPDPPPANCAECKSKLTGCVKSLMGGANGGGSATTDPMMGGSPH